MSTHLRGIFDSFNINDAVASLLAERERQCAPQIATAMARANAEVVDVEQNWKPSEFYSPDQLNQVLTLGTAVISSSPQMVIAAIQGGVFGTGDSEILASGEALLVSAGSRLSDMLGEAQPFFNGLAEARDTRKNIIHAPSLKRWVVRVLKAARDFKSTLFMVGCAHTQTVGLLSQFGDLVTRFFTFVVAIAGVALQVVKAAGAAIVAIPDVVGSLLKFVKFLPWLLIPVGVYYVGVKTQLIPADPLRLRERQTFKPWRRALPDSTD